MESVQLIPIEAIDSENRMRKQYENIVELADSIQEHGLIHPVVVVETTPEGTEERSFKLIVGGRRLRAYIHLVEQGSLDHVYIEARVWPRELTALEFRQIELSENIDREDMTWQEEVSIKAEIHKLELEISGGTATLAETAAKLNITAGTLSRDLALAKAQEKSPALADVKKKGDAHKALMAAGEAKIKAELARRAENKIAVSGIDEYRKKIRNSFIVGDSFELIRKIPDNSVDLIDLDPPYGINLGDSMTRTNDGSLDEFHEWDIEDLVQKHLLILDECARVLKPTGWLILWHSMWYSKEMYEAADTFFTTSRLPLVWVRPGKQGRTNHPATTFVCDYETAFYCRMPEAKLNQQGPSSIFPYSGSKNKIHPTEKPIDLLEDMYQKFVDPLAIRR